METKDIPDGLSLCRAAGWNQRSADWELFLKINKEGCRVALDDGGKVVGTVTTVRYEDHFSWIGMVLVDPARRREGIGIQLLNEAISIVGGQTAIKLDATPAGREIYLKLDFQDEYPLSRLHCGAVKAASLIRSSARLMTSNDIPILLQVDEEVFGAKRSEVIESAANGAPQYAVVMEDLTGIKGYCLGRYGHHYTQIGPLIADDWMTAKHLISAALINCIDQPVIIDVPGHSREWLEWLGHVGFIEQRPFIRMFLGTNSWPGKPEKQFAILGPEFG
jgi:GNAT superfamily N-acetyltransferase